MLKEDNWIEILKQRKYKYNLRKQILELVKKEENEEELK
jgi:hypothetical protein